MGENTNVLALRRCAQRPHGCKAMVRGRVWERDVLPSAWSTKPKLLQSSKVVEVWSRKGRRIAV